MTEEFKAIDAKEVILNHINDMQARRTGTCVATVLTYDCLVRNIPYKFDCIDCSIDRCILFPMCDSFEKPWWDVIK